MTFGINGVKDSDRKTSVKLLTLTHAEVEDIRQKAATLTASIAKDYEAIYEAHTQKVMHCVQDCLCKRATLASIKDQFFPEEFKLLKNIHRTFIASGIDVWAINDASNELICSGKFSLEYFEKHLVRTMIGAALRGKITISDLADSANGHKPSVKDLIDSEVKKRGAYLDTWTALMAGQEPGFDARQAFRDKTKGSKELYVDAIFFIPDQIEGIEPIIALDTPYPPTELGTTEWNGDNYHYGRGWITKDYVDANKHLIRMLADLYTLDHRLLDAMEKTGGVANRDEILDGYSVMAHMASHDAIHGSHGLPSGIPGTVINDMFLRRTGLAASLNGVESFNDETHAGCTHIQIMHDLIEKRPAIMEALTRQAFEFADTLSEWKKNLIALGEAPDIAHNMAAFMAHQYIERMNCNWDLNDPIFHTKVDAGNGNTRSIADAFGQFAPENLDFTEQKLSSCMWEIPNFMERTFGKRLPNLPHGEVLSKWESFILQHADEPENRSPMEKHESDLVAFHGQGVPVHKVTTAFHELVLGAASQLGTTEKIMKATHSKGQSRVLASRAARVQLRRDMQLDEIAELLSQLDSQLPADAPQSLTNAIEKFRIVANRVGITIENQGRVHRRTAGKTETEFLQAIKQLDAALRHIPDDDSLGHLASAIVNKLQIMETTWKNSPISPKGDIVLH